MKQMYLYIYSDIYMSKPLIILIYFQETIIQNIYFEIMAYATNRL